MTTESIPAKMVRKLEARTELNDADRAAVLALPFATRTYEAPSYVLREGEPSKRYCSFIIDGIALRQKLTATGGRQIVSIHVAGDFLDLQHLFLDCADHSVQALTKLHVAEIDRDMLKAITLERPNIGRAMWIDALVDASISREWIVNVGRRDARSRVAHLLCEFSLRMQFAGKSADRGYELPMTQEQLGDAVGLTPVHVNRTLRALAEEGLIERDKRHIRFTDWRRISSAGDFNPLYLHLGQTRALDA